MVEISALTDYIDLVILGICLCIGFVVKKWVNDVDNRYIPTIVLIIGVILSIVTHIDDLSLSVVLSGMISGLASTGLHQAFTQLIGTNR